MLSTLERNELNSFFNTMVSEGIYFKDPDFWKNINSIVKKELPPNTSYSDYFNDTHKSSEFSSIWEYIETNYSEYIKSYVDNVQENGAVDNNTCTELFVVVAQKVQGILDELPKGISEEACCALIEYGHIKINKANVHTLVDMSYVKAIYNWLRKVEEQDQNELIECLCNEDIDRIQEYLDISLNLIKCEKSACSLIKAMKGKTKIFRLTKENLILFVITEFPIIPENIKYICDYFSDFKYKKEFVDSLTSHNQFQDLTDENLNKDVMNYLITGTLVSIENKVKLLQTKIQNEVKRSELKEYIDSVDEIKDLNEVWNHKQPELNNTYKKDIGKALADNGYVKIRNDSPTPYIVFVESK